MFIQASPILTKTQYKLRLIGLRCQNQIFTSNLKLTQVGIWDQGTFTPLIFSDLVGLKVTQRTAISEHRN